MIENAPHFAPVILYASPLFPVFIAMEWYFVKQKRWSGLYERKDAIACIIMGAGNLVSDLALGFISYGFLVWLWQFRVLDWGLSIGAVVAALIAQDFVYYLKHMAAHKVRWFWSAHIVHHSSQYYNLAMALRQPWNNHFTGHVLLTSPLILLGVHPALFAFVVGLNLLYQFWIHTEAIDKMPNWFEFIMNTPSHHRVHHSTHPNHLDANFAGIFIIWDRMFGTFVGEGDKADLRYGVVQQISTFNPFRIAFDEMINVFKDAAQKGLSVRQRLGYIFAPPGYSHDASRKTTAMLKAEFEMGTKRMTK